MIDRLRDELLGNARLRWGLAAIVVLVLLYAILVLRDSGRASRATAAGPEARIAAIRGSAGQADLWRSRAERSRGLLAEYEEYVWHDATLAQAQAALQDLIAQKLASAGLRARELTVGGGIDPATASAAPATAPGASGEPVKIRARVVFEYQRPALATFVFGMLDGPRHVGLDRFLVRTTPTPVAEIEMFALYRPAAGPGR